MDLRKCRRCLIYETADKAAYESIKSYIDSIPAEERADGALYDSRLAVCRECDFLLTGMCRKCGCYVEVRAAGIKAYCPAEKW